jgi:putative transposase
MSNASFYNCRSKYGGVDVSMMNQMKALEAHNRHLKKVDIEMSMQAEFLKAEVVRQNWIACQGVSNTNEWIRE